MRSLGTGIGVRLLQDLAESGTEASKVIEKVGGTTELGEERAWGCVWCGGAPSSITETLHGEPECPSGQSIYLSGY